MGSRPVPRRIRSAALRAWVGVAILAACGSSSGPRALTPSGPWSPELSSVFDDTIDFVMPLRTILGTPWFDEYGAQLERRLADADIIAVVAVLLIHPEMAMHSDPIAMRIRPTLPRTARSDSSE